MPKESKSSTPPSSAQENLETAESGADISGFSMHFVVGIMTTEPDLAEQLYTDLAERLGEQAHVLISKQPYDGKVMLVPVEEDKPETELLEREDV